MLSKDRITKPDIVIASFLLLIFLALFSSIYSFEKNTLSKYQSSSSMLTMNSISNLFKSEIKSTVIESIRVIGFIEDREYNSVAGLQYGFLYPIILNETREVLTRRPEIERVSIVRDGKRDIDTYSESYVKESYKVLSSTDIIEEGRIIHIEILKGELTEKITLMTRVHAISYQKKNRQKTTYVDIFNQINLSNEYDQFKADGASIVVVSGENKVEKVVGTIDSDDIATSLEVFKGRFDRAVSPTSKLSSIISDIERNNEIADDEFVVCGFKIMDHVSVLYIERFGLSNFSNFVLFKIFLISISVIISFVLVLYFIKKCYMDEGVKFIHRHIKKLSSHPRKLSTLRNQKNIRLDEKFNYGMYSSLIADIHILENNIGKKTKRLYELEHRDLKTNLPNENELKRNIEALEREKNKHVYLALFYIQPSKEMSSAIRTLMGQASSIHNQVSNEIHDAVFEVRDDFESIVLYKTSIETFSIMATTKDVKMFESLCRDIAQQVTKDRFENNIHFVTHCFCSWMSLDFTSDIKSSYSSKLNRTMEYAISNNKIVQKFNNDIAKNLKKNESLRFEAHRAFDKNEFYLLYQPIFSIQKNIMTGVHVYPKWMNSSYGEIGYDEFMPIFNDLRMGKQVQSWFINEAFREVNEWRKSGYRKLDIFIRISKVQMSSSSFVSEVKRSALDNSIANEQVNILLSPDVFESNSIEIKRNIDRLNASGFNISINNYGVPYRTPSLIGLWNHKINKIIFNIDCVREVTKSVDKAAFLTPLYHICNELGIEISCNAVGDIDLARKLSEIGINEISGHSLAKPTEAFKLTSYFDFNTRNRLNPK